MDHGKEMEALLAQQESKENANAATTRTTATARR